jgi:hypothetical protein
MRHVIAPDRTLLFRKATFFLRKRDEALSVAHGQNGEQVAFTPHHHAPQTLSDVINSHQNEEGREPLTIASGGGGDSAWVTARCRWA